MSFLRARPVATYDFYGPVHKGIRLAQGEMLTRLGAASGEDPEALADMLSDLVSLLHMAEHHLENEDRWVHTALEARAPGAALRLALGHARHREAFEALEALIGQVETASDAARPALLRQLYLRFSLHVADDLTHMAEEEQLLLPILQSLFTDEELQGVEDRILSTLTPHEVIAFGRFMIPAATQPERVAMLSALRATAPAEAFETILTEAARPALSPADYANLCRGLGVQPPWVRPAPGELRWGRVPRLAS